MPTEVVVDCNGVGYHIHISLHTFFFVAKFRFYKIIYLSSGKRRWSFSLWFIEKAERELFKLLISVSGIGANTARTMLSSQILNKLSMLL
jgi:Holliday junction DNA helicase RuvA